MLVVAATAHASPGDEITAAQASIRTLPKHNLLRFEPQYTSYHEGGDEFSLRLRLFLAYRGLFLPKIGPPWVYSALRIDLPMTSQRKPQQETARGLGDTDVMLISGVEIPHCVLATGVVAALPTATDASLGDDRFQVGPAAAIMVTEVPHLELSILVRAFLSVSGDPALRSTRIKPSIGWKITEKIFLKSDGEIEINWVEKNAKVPVNLILGYEFTKHLVMAVGPEVIAAGPGQADVTVLVQIDYVKF